jgi:single-strand DNA-binding protein
MIHAFGMARLGRDAELRYTPNGDAVCNLSLAFSYGKKGDDGYRPTQWVDATLWGRRAEALTPYLLKGAQIAVAVEDLHIEFYKNRDGAEMPKLAARVVDVDLSGGAPPQERPVAPSMAQRAPLPAAARTAAPPRAPARAPAAGPSGFDDMDDDIPF